MQQVDVPGSNSAIGILPNHVPIITVLKPGKLTVKEENGEVKNFFGKKSTF